MGERDTREELQVADDGPPTVRQSSSPEPSSSPPTSPEPAWDVTAAFLPPDEAARAERPGWQVLESYEPEAGPVLDPCGEGNFPGDIVTSGEREIGSTRNEAFGSRLVQEVFRYASAEAAGEAFGDYAAAVERCPVLPDPQAEGFEVRHETMLADEVDGVRRLLVRRQPCGPGNTCTAHFRSYYLVAQTADGLTAAHYGLLEDGDPADDARALLAVTAEKFEQTVTGG